MAWVIKYTGFQDVKYGWSDVYLKSATDVTHSCWVLFEDAAKYSTYEMALVAWSLTVSKLKARAMCTTLAWRGVSGV